jgi:hypothetical protein
VQALLAGADGLAGGSGSDADDDGEGDEGDDDLDLANEADLEDLYDEAMAEAVAAGGSCSLLVLLCFGDREQWLPCGSGSGSRDVAAMLRMAGRVMRVLLYGALYLYM